MLDVGQGMILLVLAEWWSLGVGMGFTGELSTLVRNRDRLFQAADEPEKRSFRPLRCLVMVGENEININQWLTVKSLWEGVTGCQ